MTQIAENAPIASAHPSPGRRFIAALRPPGWALVVLAGVMCVGFPAWQLASPREGYILHLSDDAYYYFSVSAHIAAGQGPTADGITPTTGWHPLYGFILAGVHAATQPSLDGFVKQAIALNAVFYLLSGFFLYLAGRRWWGRFAGTAAALLWLTNPYGVLIANMGLEGGLYGLMLAALAWRLAVFVTTAHTTASCIRQCVVLGMVGGLVALSRTDAMLLMPVIGLAALMTGASGRGAVLSSGAPLDSQKADRTSAPPLIAPSWPVRLLGAGLFGLITIGAYGVWLLYVHHHTGEFHQGSAAVKMEWRAFEMKDKAALAVLAGTLLMWGEFALIAALKVPALKWLVTGAPILSRLAGHRGERLALWLLWLAPVILGLAYSLLLDWTRAWYYLPALMTLTLLSAGAAAALTGAVRSGPLACARGSVLAAGVPRASRSGGGVLNRLQRLAGGCIGLIAWVVLLESAILFGRGVYKEIDADSEKIWALKMAGWLERNLEPRTRVGIWHSGIIGYYTPSLDVINLDGLNNNEILQILRGRKTLNAYWDERNITVIVGRPRDKMGSFQTEWAGKQLIPWDRPPRQTNPNEPPSIEEQVLPQKVQRIVNAAERQTPR